MIMAIGLLFDIFFKIIAVLNNYTMQSKEKKNRAMLFNTP